MPWRCWLTLAFLLTAGLCLGAAGKAKPVEPAPLTVIDNQVFQPRRQPPVVFRHDRHAAARIACTQCHHDYVGGRNRWRQGEPVEPCAACHPVVAAAGKIDLKNAYHRQCKDCHLRRAREGRAAGPVQCRGCHQLL